MTTSAPPTPLDIHTLDSLCADLVNGRGVLVDAEGTEFCFKSAETRALFEWYRRNRDKWSRNVQIADVEALADQIDTDPPVLASASSRPGQQQKRVLHLKSVRAHRFAGLHRFGSPDSPPEDFEFEFHSPVTLIEGMNGAGKTSLLSAVSWCMCGCIYRSQRPPEALNEPLSIAAEESELTGEQQVTPVTPLPSAQVLQDLGKTPVPIDTWVELAFADDSGTEVARIRRALTRSTKGKIQVVEPDLSTLALPPIALDIGTKMPGLIPYIQLGKPSDLGKAVATMTGIRPLQDLAKHAAKSQSKLGRDLPRDRQNEISELDSDYRRAQQELARLLTDHPEIAPRETIPEPSSDQGIEAVLLACSKHLEARQAQAFAESKAILGDSFDPNDRAARQDLIDNVGPARGLLDGQSLSRLPSAARLRCLAELTDEQILQAEALITKLQNEAHDLARLAAEPNTANRLRLYARVAGWMKGQTRPIHDIIDCPVCQGTLGDQADPVTGKLVKDHLQQFLSIETDYLEKTLQDWQDLSLRRLAADLSPALANELKRDLPDSPVTLISAALCDELFESRHLRGSMAALQSAVQGLCSRELGAIPPFVEPELPSLPLCFNETAVGLPVALRRLARAIGFARWRGDNKEKCSTAFKNIVGGSGDGIQDKKIENWSLADRLSSLDAMVQRATPLKEALSKIATMDTKLAKRRQKEARIALYARTVKAVEPILELDLLVERQVASLMKRLCSETMAWKDRLYSPAFQSAPRVLSADVGADASLTFEAVAGGTKASAHQISNASDLRATLLAFLISFWRHLLDTSGGVSLLLIDDVHELFDAQNRRRVANAMPLLFKSGGRLIVTSNDRRFGLQLSQAFVEADSASAVERRYLHPPNGVNLRVEMGVFQEDVDAKRQEFEKAENEDKHQPARDYSNELRIYLEDRLLSLFDVRPTKLPEKPTLSDLIGAIRSLRNAGHEPFDGQVFGNLLSDPALEPGSSFLALMNNCHHAPAKEVTYRMVKGEADACKRACTLVGAAYEAYERWLRRDPAREVAAMPEEPGAFTFRVYEVPIIEKLAAFTAEAGPSEPVEGDSTFSTGLLNSHAIYVIKTHNLGFAGPAGCRAIVKLSVEPSVDNSLVIALHRERVFAGRLHRDPNRPDVIVISSEAENPLKRSPSLFLPTNEVRLLEISGVLFDFRPDYSRSSEDAVLDSRCGILDRIELVLKVDRDSALPLAIEGQSILGGARIVPSDFEKLEGTVVAVQTSEGCALKRIGKPVPGAGHVRQFLSVGGLGESLLVRTEDVEEDGFSGLPLLHTTREVLGVLY